MKPGIPDSFISVKLPRTNIDDEDIPVHRRVAIKQGGTLTLGGAYLWDIALLLEGLAAENESTCELAGSIGCYRENEQRTCPTLYDTHLMLDMTLKALYAFLNS